MLPSSWPGTLPFSRIGSPLMSASAMVPGPALVTMTSQPAIHSCRLSTKPHATTLMPLGYDLARSLSSSFLLRPQITTTWQWSPSCSAMWSTVSSSLPMPSPPPTSSTAGTCGSSPSTFFMRGLGGRALEKIGRMGRPCTTICSSCSPLREASILQYSVGTKQRVTPVWNQVLWQVVKSVTTVAKLMGFMTPLRMRERSTRMGTCCISGWTDTTRSGWNLSNAWCRRLEMKRPTARR
mmetsp:Transcript_13700/g.29412  ORF Transcript_13700/g.29412 Transcript_13700/m.29412 type:complete len:237 (+) Transcript_13700:1130-1840(+)